jgi:hypothetical protein
MIDTQQIFGCRDRWYRSDSGEIAINDPILCYDFLPSSQRGNGVKDTSIARTGRAGPQRLAFGATAALAKDVEAVSLATGLQPGVGIPVRGRALPSVRCGCRRLALGKSLYLAR